MGRKFRVFSAWSEVTAELWGHGWSEGSRQQMVPSEFKSAANLLNSIKIFVYFYYQYTQTSL